MTAPALCVCTATWGIEPLVCERGSARTTQASLLVCMLLWILAPPMACMLHAGAPASGGQHVPLSAARQGEYTCAAAYPTAERSVRLGRQNLHMFRLRNTRFDIVGGILYFIFVVRSCSSFPV